jgi:hypothetical protein
MEWIEIVTGTTLGVNSNRERKEQTGGKDF